MGFDDIMDALGEMADIADDLTNLPQVLKKIRTSSQKKPVSQQTGVPKSPTRKKKVPDRKQKPKKYPPRKEPLKDKQMPEETAAAVIQEKTNSTPIDIHGFTPQNPEEMRQAIIWAELLGEPLAKKRRKQRMERYYGNQGNARRG